MGGADACPIFIGDPGYVTIMEVQNETDLALRGGFTESSEAGEVFVLAPKQRVEIARGEDVGGGPSLAPSSYLTYIEVSGEIDGDVFTYVQDPIDNARWSTRAVDDNVTTYLLLIGESDLLAKE